jgi:hypothetical protein
MRRVVLMLVIATGCGDNGKPAVASDAGGDAVIELKPCLDRPTDLARPPTGQLSCDLLPPDFK